MYFDIKDLQKSQSCLIKAANLDSKDYEVYAILGQIYHEKNDMNKADTYYSRAITENRYCIICYHNLGNIHMVSLQQEKALADFHNLKKFGSEYLSRKDIEDKERGNIQALIRSAGDMIDKIHYRTLFFY